MSQPFTMNSFAGKQVLALVRDGDYAHAGEEEAIDLVMAGVARDAERLILDVGCGRGGTADYLRRNGWGRVIGLDIESTSIAAARRAYPDIDFRVGDAADADRHVSERPDIICMFNAYYCFGDQPGALRALRAVAQPHTRMIVFDHVDRGGYRDDPLMDAGEPFLPNPLRLADVGASLVAAGWRPPEIVEIHDAYIGWYARLVERIDAARDRITDIVGAAGFDHVRGLYRGLLDAASRNRLGAAIITTSPAGEVPRVSLG